MSERPWCTNARLRGLMTAGWSSWPGASVSEPGANVMARSPSASLRALVTTGLCARRHGARASAAQIAGFCERPAQSADPGEARVTRGCCFGARVVSQRSLPLRQAGEGALPFAELHAAGITFPAASFQSSSRTDTSYSKRVYEHGRLVGALARARMPSHPRRPAGAGHTNSRLQRRSRSRRRSRLGLPFRRRRFSLPFRAWFGSQRSARGRVDALVAVVPADAIPRRWVAAQHFLNDTGAGSAAR